MRDRTLLLIGAAVVIGAVLANKRRDSLRKKDSTPATPEDKVKLESQAPIELSPNTNVRPIR